MKNKKAISPLIVTVLLIGFAIALAAIVMTWGTTFIRETTEETGTGAKTAMMCANLNLDISYACAGEVTVANNNEFKIKPIIRSYKTEGKFEKTYDDLKEIEKFGIEPYLVSLTGISKIEIIPIISTEDGEITCAKTSIEKRINCPST